MYRLRLSFPPALFVFVLSLSSLSVPSAAERPYGRGLTAANQERLVIDDMESIAAWTTDTPVETTLSASERYVKEGRHSLKFGNVVDYTRGEKNYPIGWPRMRKNLAKIHCTDWSGYDFFECWIYCDTSRGALPGTPLGLGFSHTSSGPRRASSFPLKEVRKDQWVKIVIPIARLLDPQDVQSVQFNISESDYKHGDRVDFYIDDMVLTRYVEPTIAALATDRRVLLGNDRQITALYTLMGHRGLDRVKVQFEIGAGASPLARSEGVPATPGELLLPLARTLPPGEYWARLSLRDARGRLIDRRESGFRVIAGPF
jgi:hypothetical protein